MSLLSHPDKSLKEHLLKVSEICKKVFPLSDEELKNLSQIIGRFHDLGKATSFFQSYIRDVAEAKKEPAFKNSPLKSHAELSAALLFYYLRKIKNFAPLPAFLAFLAVKRHHSFVEDAFENEAFVNKTLLKEQIQNFVPEVFKETGLEPFLDFSQEEMSEFFSFLQKELKPFRTMRKFTRSFGSLKDFSLYVNFLSLYSALLLADRKEVVGSFYVKFDEKKQEADSKKLFEGFSSLVLSIKPEKSIDHLRRKALKEVLSKPFDPSQRIYSLNLPTGFGKTFAGFLYALKMKSFLSEATSKNFKIIYALPFLSIIEQNFAVLKEKLEEALGRVDSTLILKHHHLSEPKYKTGDEELPFELAELLTEAWESEVVVTTFVKVFDAFFPKKRGDALRFSRLANSILILDEIQTIPVKYWEVLNQVVSVLAEKLNFYVLFMTATKPAIFKNSVGLAGKKFFKALNRYQVEVNLEEKNLEEFLETLQIEDGKNYLFIFNTIASSQRFYELFKSRVNSEVEYISAGITPFERRKILESLRKREVPFLVSTQVVEAGVDIDFDVVIRDFAPFDALTQSAGRCNRNGVKAGYFKVVNLRDESTGRFFWSYIYDPVLCGATRELLEKAFQHKAVLTESEFTGLVEEYFSIVSKRAIDEKNVKEFLDAVKYLRFRTEAGADGKPPPCIDDFQLIEDAFYKDEVFIQLDERAVEVFKAWKKAIRKLKKGKKEAFSELARLKPVFYDYVIEVSLKESFKPPFDEELGMYYVPFENLQDYYGKTGLKEPELIC